MTKEQFINKWPYLNDTRDTINPYFISDLESVIATEIAKAKEAKPEEPNGNCSTFDGSRLVDQVQPALNPIEQAYERGEKIRHKNWLKKDWIKKYSNTEAIGENGKIWITNNDFQSIKTMPEKWGLYTEPTDQVTDQVADQEQPEMCESDAIDYILTNKLNWKKLGNNRMFAIGFARTGCSFRVSFVEYHRTLSGTREVIINNIDLAEWQPVETEQPSSQGKLDNSFDKERFEAMFRAVLAHHGSGLFYSQVIQIAEEALTKLDAYYAEKKGGNNG